jgi:hypothetical protein
MADMLAGHMPAGGEVLTRELGRRSELDVAMERAIDAAREDLSPSLGPAGISETSHRPAETTQEIELVLSSLEADQIVTFAGESLPHLHSWRTERVVRRPQRVLLPVALLSRTVGARSRLDRICDLVIGVGRDGHSDCYPGIDPRRIDPLAGLISDYGVAVPAVDGGGCH